MSHRNACARCGCLPPFGAPLFTWSMAIESGHKLWTCEPCTRADLRYIETRLDPGTWPDTTPTGSIRVALS